MKSLVDFLVLKEKTLKESLAETEALQRSESCVFVDTLSRHERNSLDSLIFLLSKEKNIVGEDLQEVFRTGYESLKAIRDYVSKKTAIGLDLENQKDKIKEEVHTKLKESLEGEKIYSMRIFMYKNLRKNRINIMEAFEKIGAIVSENKRRYVTINFIAKNEKEMRVFFEDTLGIPHSLYCEHFKISSYSIYKNR